MKKFILFTILMMSAMQLFADTEQQSISLNHKGGGRSGATNYQIAACDVNGDGQINLTDLSCLIDLQGEFQN